MLALHGSADAAEFGRCVVVEGAIGLDLAAQHAEKRCEVVMEQRSGEIGDAGPIVACAAGRWVDEIAPCRDALDYVEEVANLRAFESRAVDASLIEERGGIEEAVELKAAAAGEHSTHLGGALLLLFDPRLIGGGLKCKNPGASERREGAAGDVVAQAGPFELSSTGFAQGIRY